MSPYNTDPSLNTKMLEENEFFELYKVILNVYADNIKNNLNKYIQSDRVALENSYESASLYAKPYILQIRNMLKIDLGMYFNCKYLRYFIDTLLIYRNEKRIMNGLNQSLAVDIIF